MCKYKKMTSYLLIGIMISGMLTGCGSLGGKNTTEEVTTEAKVSQIEVGDEELAVENIESPTATDEEKAAFYKVSDIYTKDNYSILTLNNDTGNMYIYTENNELATVLFAMTNEYGVKPNCDGEVDEAVSIDFNNHLNGNSEKKSKKEDKKEDEQDAENTSEEEASTEETTEGENKEVKGGDVFSEPIYKMVSVNLLLFGSDTIIENVTKPSDFINGEASSDPEFQVKTQLNYGEFDAEDAVTATDENGVTYVVKEKTTEAPNTETQSSEENTSEETTTETNTTE